MPPGMKRGGPITVLSWNCYRPSRRRWPASRCFRRLRILLERLDILSPFDCAFSLTPKLSPPQPPSVCRVSSA